MRKSGAETTKKCTKKLRTQAIEALGGECVRCRITDIRVLEVDHIYGGGHHENKHVGPYSHLRRARDGQGDDLQLLCANCHRIKTYYPEEY